jgi:TPR repeat protein
MSIFSTKEKAVTGYEEYSLSWRMIRLYTRQANKGDSNAAYKLGMYYKNFNKNYEKSIHWFEKGVEVNNMNCLFELALYYEMSINEQEHILGVKYFERLKREAEHGNEEAAKYLNKIPDTIK